MGVDVSQLTGVEQTALPSVWLRALDARSPQPILGDRGALAVARAIDYDFRGLGVPELDIWQSALRSKMIDDRVRQFVGAYPDAVVVDVGAGLDDGYRRVRPPAGVDWYSIDLPGLIAVRDQLLPPGPQEHVIAASVVEDDWAAGVPKGRPTFVLANGLFPLLGEAEVIGFFRQVTELFSAGELVFNDHGKRGKFALWLAKWPKARARQLVADQRGGFLGFNDPRTPQGWNSKLRFVEDARLAQAPEVNLFPPSIARATHVAALTEGASRSDRILRYRF